MFYVPLTGEVAPGDRGHRVARGQGGGELGLAFDTIIDADGRAASVDEFREALKRGGFAGILSVVGSR